MWVTWIAVLAVALIIAGAVIKIVRDKKKGIKCIGCPYSQKCADKDIFVCGSQNKN